MPWTIKGQGVELGFDQDVKWIKSDGQSLRAFFQSERLVINKQHNIIDVV